MRNSIKIISTIITVVAFFALNGIMFLIDITFEGSATWALVILIAIVGVILAVAIFLFLKNRNKNKLKM